jgi:hypothetical protein
MPDTSTLSPDVYMRGDTGALRQVDATGNDVAVNGWLGGVVYRNVAASTAHASSTTETLLDASYSIPANTLKAGTVVKIRFQGIATATVAAETLTVKLYIGGLTGTALLTGTATDVANDAIFAGEFTLIVRTAGASGTFVGYGTHTEVPAASGTAVHDVTEIKASTTIDTTAAQVVGVGVDWSGASANSCRLDLMIVEIY